MFFFFQLSGSQWHSARFLFSCINSWLMYSSTWWKKQVRCDLSVTHCISWYECFSKCCSRWLALECFSFSCSYNVHLFSVFPPSWTCSLTLHGPVSHCHLSIHPCQSHFISPSHSPIIYRLPWFISPSPPRSLPSPLFLDATVHSWFVMWAGVGEWWRERMKRAEYAQGRRGVKRAIIASQMEKEIEAGIERKREREREEWAAPLHL